MVRGNSRHQCPPALGRTPTFVIKAIKFFGSLVWLWLTALISLVFVDVKGLRQYSVTKHWCLNINGRPFYKSVILRNLYEAPTCLRAIDITRFQALTRTMAMMHCHNLLAKNDGFHTVCRRALRQIKGFSANHQPGALEIEARQE